MRARVLSGKLLPSDAVTGGMVAVPATLRRRHGLTEAGPLAQFHGR